MNLFINCFLHLFDNESELINQQNEIYIAIISAIGIFLTIVGLIVPFIYYFYTKGKLKKIAEDIFDKKSDELKTVIKKEMDKITQLIDEKSERALFLIAKEKGDQNNALRHLCVLIGNTYKVKNIKHFNVYVDELRDLIKNYTNILTPKIIEELNKIKSLLPSPLESDIDKIIAKK